MPINPSSLYRVTYPLGHEIYANPMRDVVGCFKCGVEISNIDMIIEDREAIRPFLEQCPGAQRNAPNRGPDPIVQRTGKGTFTIRCTEPHFGPTTVAVMIGATVTVTPRIGATNTEVVEAINSNYAASAFLVASNGGAVVIENIGAEKKPRYRTMDLE